MPSAVHATQTQTTGYYCGPAATRVALSARGQAPAQATLAAELGTTVSGTNSSADVVRVLNAHLGADSYGARYIGGQDATSEQATQLKTDLVGAIDAGYALVANVRGTIRTLDGQTYSYPGGHYVAVVGYNGDAAQIADVAVGRDYWATTAALATWIATRGYAHPLLRAAVVADLRPRRNAMFRLIDPEGAQFVVSPDTLSPTGWSYDPIVDPVSPKGWMIAASGIGTVNANPKDPNHDSRANNDWRPGAFGPSKAEVRKQMVADIAAKVLASLPPGQGGVVDYDRIEQIVDRQNDQQSAGGADKD